MSLGPSDLLFYAGGECYEKYGVACRKVASIKYRGEEFKETFTRADASTVASYVDRDGIIRRALANVLRVTWPLISGVRSAHLLLEASRVNVALRPEELEHAAWTQSSITVQTNHTVAPDGLTTAERLDDLSNTFLGELSQPITVANDSTSWVASVFLKIDTTTEIPCLRLRLTGGTELNYEVQVRGSDLALSVVNSPNVPSGFGIEPLGAGWNRVWVAGPNNTSGNVTATIRLFPAFSATLGGTSSLSRIGSQWFWGAQLENAAFPSSYIKTVAASVTRAADRLEFPFPHAPEAMTLYAHFIERAQPNWVVVGGEAPRVIQIGSSSNVSPFARITKAGGGVDRYDFQVGGNNNGPDINPVLGDRIELRALLNANGSYEMTAAKNGGAESAPIGDAGGTLPAAWSSPTLLSIGCIGANGQGDIALRSVKIARGIQTMDEMRAAG